MALIYRNALGPLGDLTYTYDAIGNRIGVGGSFARTLLPDAVASATYDQGNRQLTFGASTMTFDDNGNLLTQTDSSGTLTYTWDARNRLTMLTGPSVNASFAYDGLGRRARKSINSLLTQFLYDGADIVRELGGAGDAAYLRTLAIDEALVRSDSVDTVHFVADALRSTVALIDGAGNVATNYSYAPFGDTAVTGSPSTSPFHFTGRENDGMGFYYYRARYYQSRTGRFMTEDPIGSAGGSLNIYSYARSNPLRFTDPTGLKLWIYITASVGGGAALGGEYGKYYVIDPSTGEAHQFEYLGGGPSLGAAGGATLQGGVFDGPDDPRQLSGWGLEVNAFAAAGKGVAAQTSGTSWFGRGEAGVAAGVAAGAGASISGLVTYSWYGGPAKYLPESVEKLVKELGTRIRSKK